MRYTIMAMAALVASPVAAQQPDLSRFTTGPVFPDIGPVADVEASFEIPADANFRHSFDVATRMEDGPNRGFVSVARFINMHARGGVPAERIQTALVVHGQAAHDLLNAEAYAERFDGAANPSEGLITALTEHGVRVILCGQSAAANGIDETSDLLPGVEVALSAMTAHALLQQRGYTVNPF